jgi:hypothetical protein
MNFPLIAVNFDLSRLDQFASRMLDTDDTWNSELARHNRAV